ncbi:3-deoxy-7-phosphoheptulonate synthase [Catellatospora bangladeshensis]|uniref:Phospho-2-dehydro-3-deoxyheptonate aldolase n=1 Tax=Catellatospora bangladeshensis TaxID=310355 RepID=A0A8J3JK67_9ACTN|nr:3-deoxy-7-phosphoheptulonate synthase [Catellatospora bangladeshensis]GIF86466.1 phospho-2-dehydro-3-deoxyheptonate aldolase [Catellatospora bangladeshensis]
MTQTNDVHVLSFEPLQPPRELLTELPLGEHRAALVQRSRQEVRDVLTGRDDRLLVVVGPCSVHDTEAAMDYARRLTEAARQHQRELCIVMRVYFEKPRTTIGWKGLINDPGLDGTYDVHRGLRTARTLLLDILDLGMPVGCEFLDPTSPQYIADAVTWGAIGARTIESQVHRQLASGLSMPVGFKNTTDGGIQGAIDACEVGRNSHVFFGVDPDGRAAVVTTTGNEDCHVILRGGRSGPNYGPESVASTLAMTEKAGLKHHLVIDASHGNSGKSHERQAVVADEIAAQIAEGQHGIGGVMLESFIVAGRQDLDSGEPLVYGQSVTDACMSWQTTEQTLATLAAAVTARRPH